MLFLGGKVHINKCTTVIQLVESPDLTLLDFCLWGWMKCEVNQIKVDTRDKLLSRSLDAASRIKKGEDQLRRITRDLRTGLAKCIEADGGIFEYLL
jgi:hypothetical protein